MTLAARFRFFALITTLALVVAGAGPARGDVIAQYTFDTADPINGQPNRTGLGFEAQTVDPNATATDISISDNIR